MPELIVVAAGVTATVLLPACSAFFSSAEIAMFSLTPEWIRDRAASGDGRAERLELLRSDPHRLLVTILVGNNVVNAAVSSIVTALLVSSLPNGLAVAVATVVVSAIVLVFGEIVPKAYGLGNKETWALTATDPIRYVERGLSPVVSVFDAVTRWLAAHVGGNGEIERLVLDE
ncbi:DUF21 domain-containing protein [Halobaculum sp. D14]|uniref:DUF21 domain-containing protein n=1 Tax=unclassified Halobaculum TaxID=2640896 RepID=UPI003EB94E66